MTTHANCTHEATKAGRARCRAGRPQIAAETPASDAGARLRAKATKATEGKVGRAKRHEGDRFKKAGPMARLFMSGHCDAGRHTPICTGQYTLTPCTCPCHESDAPADGDV